MAEALDVASSAVTLAGLFTNCIECFHYFKAAQNCPEEAERMLVKVDCENLRLLVRANTIGVLDTNVRERDPWLAHPALEDVLRRAFIKSYAVASHMFMKVDGQVCQTTRCLSGSVLEPHPRFWIACSLLMLIASSATTPDQPLFTKW